MRCTETVVGHLKGLWDTRDEAKESASTFEKANKVFHSHVRIMEDSIVYVNTEEEVRKADLVASGVKRD